MAKGYACFDRFWTSGAQLSFLCWRREHTVRDHNLLYGKAAMVLIWTCKHRQLHSHPSFDVSWRPLASTFLIARYLLWHHWRPSHNHAKSWWLGNMHSRVLMCCKNVSSSLWYSIVKPVSLCSPIYGKFLWCENISSRTISANILKIVYCQHPLYLTSWVVAYQLSQPKNNRKAC